MHQLLRMSAFGLCLIVASPADAAPGRWGTDLRFVASTTIPANGGQTLSLCHLVDTMEILFVPVYTVVEGYALAKDNCSSDSYGDLSNAQLASLKADGLVAADIPDTPQLNPTQFAWGHAWLIFGALALVFRGLMFLMSRNGRSRRKNVRDTLATHALIAMSQVAVADGRIDQSEIKSISALLARLTGRGYSMDQVSDLLSRLAPSRDDLAQVGQDLSQKDRQIVLEAALSIAAADGEIHPSEYAVISDLAQRMAISADQFRTTLARASAHLNSTA